MIHTEIFQTLVNHLQAGRISIKISVQWKYVQNGWCGGLELFEIFVYQAMFKVRKGPNFEYRSFRIIIFTSEYFSLNKTNIIQKQWCILKSHTFDAKRRLSFLDANIVISRSFTRASIVKKTKPNFFEFTRIIFQCVKCIFRENIKTDMLYDCLQLSADTAASSSTRFGMYV